MDHAFQQLEALATELERRGVPADRAWIHQLAITPEEDREAERLRDEEDPDALRAAMERASTRVRCAYYVAWGAVPDFVERDEECLRVLRRVQLRTVADDAVLIRETLASADVIARAVLAASYEGDPYVGSALPDDTWRALAADPDERVRAAVAWNDRAPIRPPVDDPSLLVRAAHPETPPTELLALARHRDPRIAFQLARRVDCPRAALLIAAYRARMPLGHHAPTEWVGIACEHDLGVATSLEALVEMPTYWDPDEIVDPSSEIALRYEWFQPDARQVEAQLTLHASTGFTAAELLWAVLSALDEKDQEGTPHFEGDAHGLGKQRCLFQLVRDREGHWRAALRK